MGYGRTLPIGLVCLLAGATLCQTASADVKSSTTFQSYMVGGTTPATLVSYMKTRPFHGDRGAAVANIRPSYGLTVATAQQGGTCKATNVTLAIRFMITLPQASSGRAMSSDTRSAWGTFTAFARRHEETHRSIYVQCGNEFVAKAQQMTSSSGCGALQAKIRDLLASNKSMCDQRQLAFDRADYPRVFSLALFRMTGAKSRKPTEASASGVSAAIAAPSQ